MKKLTLIALFLFLTAMCPKGEYKVLKVQDGDTITVEGFDKPIRILGIDAPESSYNYKVMEQAERYGVSISKVLKMGEVAKQQAKNILLYKCVRLETDYRDKGKYGRPLRYVYLQEIDYQDFMLKNEMVFTYCGDKKIMMYDYYNQLSKFKCK